MEPNSSFKLSRRQFMAVYRAAFELTDVESSDANKIVCSDPDISIVDITYSLWQLYIKCGGRFRRLESRK